MQASFKKPLGSYFMLYLLRQIQLYFNMLSIWKIFSTASYNWQNWQLHTIEELSIEQLLLHIIDVL